MKNKIFISLRQKLFVITGLIMVLGSVIISCNNTNSTDKKENAEAKDTAVFVAPDTSTIPHDQFGDMVRYGRELIVNTARYIGPNGTVGKYTANKISCSNCHLDAGTRPYGFNFFSSHARYPQY